MKKQLIAITLAAVMAAATAATAPTPQTKMLPWITRASIWKREILT